MTTIVEALLSKTISEQEDIATLHIAVLHLFPRLLSLHINERKADNLLSPNNWLRSVIACPDYAAEIIRFVSNEVAKQRRPDNVPSAAC